MTATHLARIRASIDADAETLNANWPLARERERAYLALGRAVAEMANVDDGEWWLDRTPEYSICNQCGCRVPSGNDSAEIVHQYWCPAVAVDAALSALSAFAALAPEEVPDAE